MNTSDHLSEARRLLLEQRLRGAGRVPAAPPETPAGAQDSRPPSPAEEWLFRAHRLAPEAPPFNVINSFRVSGALDLPRLERAIRGLVARHEPLRSAYTLVDGDLRVSVQENVEVPLVEFACADSRDQWARAESFARKPFDPAHPPLVRFAWLTAPGVEPLLLLVGSDLVLDHWSLGVAWRELDLLYRHDAAEGALAPLGQSYGAVAAAQRQQLTSDACGRQLQYWTDRLRNLPPPLSLPTDRRYPGQLTFAGRLARGRIGASVGNGIRTLAADENASPFMVAVAAFQSLLHRYTGAQDIVIGTPVANRRGRETAGLVGLLLTTVALRGHAEGASTGRGLLRDARKRVLEALENQDVPFDRVVASVAPERVPGRHPVFQVMLVYQTAAEAPEVRHLGDALLREDLVENGASPFDVTLFLIEDPDQGFDTILEYRTDLFEHASAERLLSHFARLLEAIAADPDRPVGELPLMTSDEERQVRRFSRGETFESSAIPDVVTQIRDRAAARLDAIAAVGSHGTLSYGQLIERADAIAMRLSHSGAEGGPIGLHAERQALSIAGILGILEAGAAYVPIDPAYPLARRRFILGDAGIDTVVATPPVGSDGEVLGCRTVLLDPAEQSPAAEPVAPRRLDASDTAYIIYTSGSTGEPKGVVVSHANLTNSTEARARFYEEAPTRFLLIPSLSFDSSIAVIFWTLAQGGTLVIADEAEQIDPEALCRLVDEHAVTDLLCIPALYREMLMRPGRALRSLRRVIVAGEVCPSELVALHRQRLPKVPLFNEYGPTEATVWATVHACTADDASPGAAVPIGRPIPNGEVLVLDSRLQLTPIGVPGELYLGGAGVAMGYHDREDLTRTRFVEFAEGGSPSRRLYRTGDLGRWRADGRLEFLGRVDEQIKVRGVRVEPAEIEGILERHPAVRRAAVALASAAPPNVAALVDDPARLVETVPEAVLARALSRVEARFAGQGEGPITAPERALTPQSRTVTGEGFRLQLQTDPEFIVTPREVQRRWLLGRAIQEFTEDLQHLAVVARNLVRGTDLPLQNGPADIMTASLTEAEIMEDWQVPLMRRMASHVTETHGDVLEIGFGRGVSADMIQQMGVRSHTVVEPSEPIIAEYFEPWRARYPDADIHLLKGKWQEVEDRLGLYDGVFFHAVPLNEEEFANHMLSASTFAEHAFGPMARYLRDGGVFTYLSTEIDSLSRRHQRRLFEHFREVSLSVVDIQVPEDTRDLWWAKTMVVVKAVK